ncbi:MAG: hypothetical protein K0U47_02780 [Epsilonproteobacteria bacterium]|nr:hypothetical protein [Campylobacterota bacterium]
MYRVEKTIIGNDVFLGANAVVLPGVTINDGAIIGAGAVVTKDVAKNTVVAGNPAKYVCTVEEYRDKCRSKSCLVSAPDSFQKMLNGKALTSEDLQMFQDNVFAKNGLIQP